MMLERVCPIALRINIDHQNPAASFRHEPGQMHSEGRLPDTALLIVDHDDVHRPIRDEAICARLHRSCSEPRSFDSLARLAATVLAKRGSSLQVLV